MGGGGDLERFNFREAIENVEKFKNPISLMKNKNSEEV